MPARHLQDGPGAAINVRLLRRLRSTKAKMPASNLDCPASVDHQQARPRDRSCAQQQAIYNSNTHTRELRTVPSLAYCPSQYMKSADNTTKGLGRDTNSFCNHSQYRPRPRFQLTNYTHHTVTPSWSLSTPKPLVPPRSNAD
jgi:hypothetical protein